MRACFDWAQESAEEYLTYAEYSYDSCDFWNDRCQGGPVRATTCRLLGLLCVASTFVSTVIVVLWSAATVALCGVWGILQVLTMPLSWMVRVGLSIPLMGRLVAQALNVVEEIFWRLAGSADLVLAIVGVRPLKKLRLTVVILSNGDGPVSSREQIMPQIEALGTVLRDEANVHLVLQGIRMEMSPAPDYAKDLATRMSECVGDLTRRGWYYETAAAEHCAIEATSRLVGYGPPIIVFVVGPATGSTAGSNNCLTLDYLTIDGSRTECFVREVVHKLGLWDCCTSNNLAHDGCEGHRLEGWQRSIIRNSRFVTYA